MRINKLYVGRGDFSLMVKELLKRDHFLFHDDLANKIRLIRNQYIYYKNSQQRIPLASDKTFTPALN